MTNNSSNPNQAEPSTKQSFSELAAEVCRTLNNTPGWSFIAVIQSKDQEPQIFATENLNGLVKSDDLNDAILAQNDDTDPEGSNYLKVPSSASSIRRKFAYAKQCFPGNPIMEKLLQDILLVYREPSQEKMQRFLSHVYGGWKCLFCQKVFKTRDPSWLVYNHVSAFHIHVNQVVHDKKLYYTFVCQGQCGVPSCPEIFGSGRLLEVHISHGKIKAGRVAKGKKE